MTINQVLRKVIKRLGGGGGGGGDMPATTRGFDHHTQFLETAGRNVTKLDT